MLNTSIKHISKTSNPKLLNNIVLHDNVKNMMNPK